ncbi:MAG: acyl carrier protein [Planctomycetota bacterium]|nr:acyl carrier protein [Planctomycetota bacterium]
MAGESVEDRVRKVVCKLLKVPPEKVTAKASFVRDLGMESIQSVELIAALEEEFGCEIDEDEVADNDTFGKAVAYMEKKVGRK